MKKGISSLLTFSLPFLLLAQPDTSHGINWTQGLTWEQVKKKARSENKYIFLDCFATWCGPCKAMDKTVYVNDTLGNFFNDKFVSVKVQMDRTSKDNDELKKWYSDAGKLQDEYHIVAYPTFIFLSPEGKIVDIQSGYKKINDFLALGKTVILPGKLYDNPYLEYDKFVIDYKNGIKSYNEMPKMIKLALKLGNNEIAVEWLKDYDNNYAFKLKKERRYTQENIELWSSFLLASSTTLFRFFKNDGKLIDNVMKIKGYADKVVDQTVMDEIIQPFFKDQNNNPNIQMTGLVLTDLSGKHKLPVDSSEADWIKLGKLIEEKFGKSCVDRNILLAKVEWYNRHRNVNSALMAYITYFNNYSSVKSENLFSVNDIAWNAFIHSRDKKIINGFILIMEKAIKENNDVAIWFDTYANLLYKGGRVKEAIEAEQTAVKKSVGFYAKHRIPYEAIVSQMKTGDPTYLDEGAVW